MPYSFGAHRYGILNVVSVLLVCFAAVEEAWQAHTFLHQKILFPRYYRLSKFFDLWSGVLLVDQVETANEFGDPLILAFIRLLYMVQHFFYVPFAEPFVAGYNHFELKVGVFLQQFIVNFFPHLQLFHQRDILFVVIEKVPSDVPHLNNEHILFQALFETVFDAFPEEWLVLDKIIHESELILKVVEYGPSTWTIISQWNQLPEIIIKLVLAHAFS